MIRTFGLNILLTPEQMFFGLKWYLQLTVSNVLKRK